MSEQSEEIPEPFPERKTLGHRKPDWVGAGAVFFVTICTQPRGKNQLCKPKIAQGIFEAIEYRHSNHKWFCRLCLLMPDHLHALVSFPPQQSLQRGMSNFKEHTAKRHGISWQRDFFDHRIRDANALQLKANYIRQNPIRVMLTENAETWPYLWEPS